jgi:Na+:H+ antiporter, NhaA family
VVLFLFGLTHGGIDIGALAPTTLIVLGAAWVGKPLGILAAAIGTGLALGLRLPAGLTLRDLLFLSVILGMSFSAPALMLDPALPGGAVREAARLGFAVSLLAGPFALLVAMALGRQKTP